MKMDMNRAKRVMTGWTKTFGVDGKQKAEYRSIVARFSKLGRKAEELVYDEYGNLECHKEFNSEGHITQEIHHNPDGSLNFRYSYKYDSAGNEIEQAMFFAGGQFHGRWVSTIGDGGKIAERQWRNGLDEVEVTEEYEYGMNGKAVRKTRGAVAQWLYSYDANGNLSRIRGGYYSSDEPGDIEFHYNEDGDLSEKIELYPSGSTAKSTRYKYIFWE